MSQKETNTAAAQSFMKLFHENEHLLINGTHPVVNESRKHAIAFFEKNGLPDKKSENYKYSDIVSLFSEPYSKFLEPQTIDVDLNDVFRCDVPELDTHLVLLINSWYYQGNKPLQGLPEGVIVGSLADNINKYPDIINKYYHQLADKYTDSLSALNSAFARDGIFIYVPRGVVIEKPIQIVNIMRSDSSTFAQQRNLIIMEENSQAKVIICDHTLSPHRYLTNTLSEIYIHKNTVFDYYNVQNEHNDSSLITNTYIRQHTGSELHAAAISLHGGFIRNNLHVDMDEPNCSSNVYGMFLTDQNQHIDNFTRINHSQPDCNSKQLYKGILDNDATGVFNGRIFVARDAQQTNAFQANNNILMSGTSRMRSKPQLEIYADDVKCSHGATVGRLDENALFYLRARGIPEKEARLMLMYAFADAIIEKVRVKPLRERIIDLVDKRLRGEFTRCHYCCMKCN